MAPMWGGAPHNLASLRGVTLIPAPMSPPKDRQRGTRREASLSVDPSTSTLRSLYQHSSALSHRVCVGEGLWVDKGELEHAPEELWPLYQCRWGDWPCSLLVDGTQIGKHLPRWHGVTGRDKDPATCFWNGCGERMNKESLARHICSKHLLEGLMCVCGTKLIRYDAWQRHCQKRLGCQMAEVVPVHGPDVHFIDIRTIPG
ncbi:hypothetical protein BV22DRAFT_121972 [Leucogyrophana mollusca]|uniref:Uncharacterized protein n=1 Tax=Leucogyrophana mollusca TaxID=85980 RepID=A0ACB8BUH6_9AGAM|nr:hypothetical protein BV22DRAFT_121972 [Leucogyrophana mollusca]